MIDAPNGKLLLARLSGKQMHYNGGPAPAQESRFSPQEFRLVDDHLQDQSHRRVQPAQECLANGATRRGRVQLRKSRDAAQVVPQRMRGTTCALCLLGLQRLDAFLHTLGLGPNVFQVRLAGFDLGAQLAQVSF